MVEIYETVIPDKTMYEIFITLFPDGSTPNSEKIPVEQRFLTFFGRGPIITKDMLCGPAQFRHFSREQ